MATPAIIPRCVLLGCIWLLTLVCVDSRGIAPPRPKAAALMKAAVDAERAGRFQVAVDFYQQAAELFLSLANQSFTEQDWQSYCDCLNQMGWDLAVYLGDYDRAREVLEHSVTTGETHLPRNHDQVMRGIHTLAVVSYYQNRLDEALELNNDLLKLRREKFGEEHAEVAATLNNLGLVYFAKGEMSQAQLFYEQSLAIKEKLQGPNHPSSATTHLNLGRIHTVLGNLGKAIDHLETCHKIRTDHLHPDHPEIAASAYVLGMALIEKGELHRAQSLLELASEIQIEAMGEENPHRAHTLWELGKTKTLTGKGTEALELFTRSLAIMKDHYGEHDYHVAESLNHLAWYFWKEERLELALDYMNQALDVLQYQPGGPRISASIIDETLIRCLQGRAVIGLSAYHAHRNWQELTSALAAIDDAVTVIAQKRMGFLSQKSKLSLNRRYHRLLTMAVHASLELYRQSGEGEFLERAFSYSEKSKMAVLLDTVHESRAQSFAGIPRELLTRERELKSRIYQYDTRLAQLIETQTPEIDATQKNLIQAYEALETFTGRLQTEYPSYYRLKYSGRDFGTLSLQNLVTHEKLALVAYHLGHGLLTIFSITKKGARVEQVSLETGEPPDQNLGSRLPVPDWLARDSQTPTSLILDIEKLRNSMVFSRRDVLQFYARKLFRTLMRPIYSELKGKSLVIVPDAQFGYLPFEVLLTGEVPEETGSWNLPYLLKDHTISYLYSTQLNPEPLNQGRVINPRNGVAFAPVFQTGGEPARAARRDGVVSWWEDVRPLPYTEQEVKMVARLFRQRGIPFQVFTHQAANESTLKDFLGEADLIHIATHGLFDLQQSRSNRLLLAKPLGGKEDGLLYLNELYARKMKARLVVLSSCDSGLGAITSGEGILGFCRGLFYAGAKSVVVSYWQVSDQSTTELMAHFYGQLLAGRSPAEALSLGKLTQIEQNTPPYFWAPFVLIGQPGISMEEQPP